MGWTDLFQGIAGGAAGSVVDFGLQALGNAVLPMSKAQRQQNEYAAEEARKGRDFTSQQAEINRDWQEEMYARYNSLPGKIAQAREAGVNPLYAVTGSATSPMSATPSPASPSVASPSSVGPMGQISDMVGAVLGFSKLSAEIKNINSITRNQNAQALKTELEALWVNPLNEQTVKESQRRIQSADVSDAEKIANTNLLLEKIFTEEATQAEKAQNVLYLSSEVRKNEAEMGLILSRIKNTDADTEYKSALTAGALISNSANEKYLARLMSSQLNINQKEAQKLAKEMRQMTLDYGHDKVMYALEEIITHSDATNAAYLDPSNYTGVNRELRIFLNQFKDYFNFSAAVVGTTKF